MVGLETLQLGKPRNEEPYHSEKKINQQSINGVW